MNQIIEGGRFSEINTGFKGYVSFYRFKKTRSKAVELKFFTLSSIMSYLKRDIVRILEQSLARYGPIKVQFSPRVTFMRKNSLDEVKRIQNYVNSYVKIFLNSNTINEIVSEAYSDLMYQIEKFETYGSGWILELVSEFDMRIGKFSVGMFVCFTSNNRSLKSSFII